MTDKRRKQQTRGAKAKQLLENPLLIDAFERVEHAILNQWKDSKDPQEREQLWNEQHGLAAVKSCLELYVITGKATQKELERK